MHTEREYFEHFYSPNFYSDDYNLDIKEKDNSFQEQYYNFFSPGHLTNSEFVENFMKIDHSVDFLTGNQNNSKKSENKSKKDAYYHNDSVSTHSSLNLNLNHKVSESICENKIDQSLIIGESSEKILLENSKDFFLKVKKGRPMEDSNLIIDEVNEKVYDHNLDPSEYRKARKYV